MLSDASIVEATPLAELKTMKSFLKIVSKCDKDLEILKRKHEKVNLIKIWTFLKLLVCDILLLI